MKWTPGASRENVEDRRGQKLSIGKGGLGIGGFLVLLVLSVVFKRDFFQLVGAGGGQTAEVTENGPVKETPEEAQRADFITYVLNDAQGSFGRQLSAAGTPYQNATLVLFRDAVRSGCGVAQSAMGPFYCPADGKVYIDLGFYEELHQRFGAAGDFAEAYVVAHELGHHVQNLLGTADKVRSAQQDRPDQANELSVRTELQADCYAGIWAHDTANRNLLEKGDVEEGLAAASSVGDDRIQAQATGEVHPESFTHGSAKQRAEWFRRGYESGNLASCDTFR
jgi:uncharacterized protein